MKTKTKKPKFTLPELERSYLIQRLRKPIGGSGPLAALANAFSFGGGYKNGGLSDNAMSLIRDIFEFDYMGASEFEWGAVPKAFQKIAQFAEAGVLSAFDFKIPYTEVERPEGKRGAVNSGDGTVYVLCPQPWTAEIMSRIRYYAQHPYGGDDRTMRLMETTFLNRSLQPVEEWDTRISGWLELDNGYMFFTDQDMWAKTCDLFGVER